MSFLTTLAFVGFESTFSLFGRERFDLTEGSASFVFLGIGIVLVVVQGILFGRAIGTLGVQRLYPLALVLVETDDTDATQRALEMAQANAAMTQNSPQQVPAATTLAWVFYKMNRKEDAANILDQISRNNALSTDGAYYVAKILSDRGEKDRAKQILQEVLANEPMFATRPDAKDLLDKLSK